MPEFQHKSPSAEMIEVLPEAWHLLFPDMIASCLWQEETAMTPACKLVRQALKDSDPSDPSDLTRVLALTSPMACRISQSDSEKPANSGSKQLESKATESRYFQVDPSILSPVGQEIDFGANESNDHLYWKYLRKDGMSLVEVRDSSERTSNKFQVQVQVQDGFPVRIEFTERKQVLACRPDLNPKSELMFDESNLSESLSWERKLMLQKLKKMSHRPYRCAISLINESNPTGKEGEAARGVETNLVPEFRVWRRVTLKQAGEYSWTLSQPNGLVTAKIQDSAGQVIMTSTTSPESPLTLQVTRAKQVLRCQPIPKKEVFDKLLAPEPQK
ncbi:MAG: hypothetical protein C5B49_15720 [Bdellovibrio sp.]|nr:MAG: hypothetical protein C5B49_15720 [Bdellovibrio sp.]